MSEWYCSNCGQESSYQGHYVKLDTGELGFTCAKQESFYNRPQHGSCDDLSHAAELSRLRKLVEAQGKVVEAARKYEKLHAAAQAGFFYRAVSIGDTMIAQMELFDELRKLDAALLLALKETEEKS